MRPLHHTDTDPGWINRKFKDLDRQLRQLRTTTVVNLSAADPSTLPSVADFEYDVFTATAPGMQVLTLDYVPKDDSVHVHWHPGGGAGIFLLDAEWTIEANVITVLDPDGIYETGDEFSVKYAREGWAILQVRHPAEFIGASSTIAPMDDLSEAIAIPAHTAGDTLILFAARGDDIAPPAGWTLLESCPAPAFVASWGIPTLYAFTKQGNGSETSVVISTTNLTAGNVMLAGVVLAYRGQLTGSTTGSVDPATSASVFDAPTLNDPTLVVAAMFDGDGAFGSGDETIAVTMSGATRANISPGPGNWALAVAEGTGTFTDAAADAGAHLWLGICIGMEGN